MKPPEQQMTYILYIPDTARGETAYTQRTFATIKELAHWIMDTALDTSAPAPAPAPAPSPAPLENIIDVLLPAVIIPAVVIDISSESEWNVDASSWFTEESEISRAVAERNWKQLAHIVTDTICTASFSVSEDARVVLSREDITMYLTAVSSHLPYLTYDLFPALTDLRWDLLPEAFNKSLKEYIECFSLASIMKGRVCGYVASHPMTRSFFNILSFFRVGKHHTSWNQEVIKYKDVELFRDPPHKVASLIVHDWWSLEKTTDEIREFMIKLTMLRFFINGNKASTIGSAEFLKLFFKHIMNLELPSEFIQWAVKGITHRHCKKALEELNIIQVRRAEGQRFIGLEEISELNDKYIYNYNPLFSNHISISDGILEAFGGNDISPYLF